jgi:hypothetical protein
MKLRNTVKKIAALTTGTAMIGATMMGAMAAVDLQQYPAPFVSNGTFQGYFVVGETAMPADVISMTDIGMSLQAAAVVETVVPLPGEYSQTVVSGGAKFASASQELFFGRSLSDSKSTFTDADLPVLQKTQVTTTDGVNFDVEFRVSAPEADLKYGRDVNNLDDPTFYVDFNSGAKLNMTILFPRSLNISRLHGESIVLFGKEFVVAEGAETSQALQKLTLYMATIDRTFEAGTTQTVSVGSNQYTVTVIGVNTDRETATVTINGETRQVEAGRTYTFGGERFYVKDVMGYTQPVGGGAVRLFIGSEKLVLEEGADVTMGQNDDVVQGASVSFGGSSTETSSITVSIEPSNTDDRVEGLELGQEYVDPVFGALKIAFADSVPGLMDTNSRDTIKVYPSANDRLSVRFTNYVGQEYNLEVLRGEGVSELQARYGTGDRTYVLAGNVNATGSTVQNASFGTAVHTALAKDNRFVLRQDANSEYTRVLQLVSATTTGSPRVRLQDTSIGGTTQEFSAPDTWSGTGVAAVDGQPRGTLSYDGAQYDFAITGTDAIVLVNKVVSNVVITRRGASLALPMSVANSSDTAAYVLLTEETAFNDGEPRSYGTVNLSIRYDTGAFTTGRKVRVLTPVYTADGSSQVSAPSSLVSSDSNSDRQAMVTPYGTYVWYDSSDSVSAVDLYYPRSQMHFNVFLAPAAATTISGGGEGEITSQQVNRINVGSVIFDTQAVNLIGQENMIVVGGPCVNTVAMRLMGTPAVCTEGFEVGKAWIKYFEHQDGKVSLMVAGYSARDTTLAGQVLANYDRYQAQLQGMEVVVSGGSLSQVQITAPAQ